MKFFTNSEFSVDIADISCGINTYFGDSTDYMLLNYKVDIELARILNRDNKVNYDDIVNWKTRDFKSFSEKFGEPYAEETDNDKGDSQPSKVYFYDIIDSDKYARVSVYNSNGMINTLTIEDVTNPRSEDNQKEVILDNGTPLPLSRGKLEIAKKGLQKWHYLK